MNKQDQKVCGMPHSMYPNFRCYLQVDEKGNHTNKEGMCKCVANLNDDNTVYGVDGKRKQ